MCSNLIIDSKDNLNKKNSVFWHKSDYKATIVIIQQLLQQRCTAVVRNISRRNTFPMNCRRQCFNAIMH